MVANDNAQVGSSRACSVMTRQPYVGALVCKGINIEDSRPIWLRVTWTGVQSLEFAAKGRRCLHIQYKRL